MFDAVRQKITHLGEGFRTAICVGVVSLVGVADATGSVDITPFVTLFVSDKAKLGTIIVTLAILFGVMRYLTTTPMFQPPARQSKVDEGH